MNQTRTFLFFAWLTVAALLWFEWSKGPVSAPVPAAPSAVSSGVPAAAAPVGLPAAANPDQAGVPVPAPATPAAATPAAAVGSAGRVRVRSDVLDLWIDLRGASVVRAELLRYPVATSPGSPNVVLFNPEAPGLYAAQSGWVAAAGEAPTHLAAYRDLGGRGEYRLPDGAARLEVPLEWIDPASGLRLRKVFVLERGRYAVGVRETLANGGAATWQGHPYQQLMRVAPPAPSRAAGFTNPESFSFTGAAWYTPEEKFDKRAFDDFGDGGALPQGAGGWLAMLQHHFVGAWVPPADEAQRYSLETLGGALPHYVVRAEGAPVQLAAGRSLERNSTLWVGPKLQAQMETVAPGLKLSLDYGIFSFIAQPLFWLLNLLHSWIGNWGWAIVALVVLIKLALFKLSEAQYRSGARMRALQPRLQALQERYGEDRQKYAMAQMELFKKEGVSPFGGCLPILVTIPIFFALYWVLLESVELRQASWIPGWIDNLTDADPFFILPVLNISVMFLTQKLTPMPGMDPMQKKILTWMPMVFGVLMAFFPAGLVLYWVTNGSLGLLQQWVITRRIARENAARAASKTIA